MRDPGGLAVDARRGSSLPDQDTPDEGVLGEGLSREGPPEGKSPEGHAPAALPLRVAVELPADPLSIGVARALVRSLAPRLSPDRLRRAELVVSEVVTNAVRHSAPDATADIPIRLELVVGRDGVEGRVHDRGEPFTPGARPSGPDEPGGFGLFVVSRLTRDWSLTHDGTGNVLTFVV